MGSTVTGWGIALPERRLTNAELAANLGISESWIEERTGIRTRRVAGPDDTTSSLATAAGEAALDDACVDPAEVDMVIVATSTPDYQIPATAPLVQARLGASRAGAYDVGAGCSGFLYALAQAAALVDAGTARCVLVAGADVLSRVIDYTDPKTSVLFGDGAGAAVVQPVDDGTRIGPFVFGSDGSEPNLLVLPPEEGVIRMNGKEVYRRAVEWMTRSVVDVLAAGGLGVEAIDLLVAHQANGRILDAVASRLGLLPDRVAMNIADYGNTSAASIPLAVTEAAADGRLAEGDTVVITAFGAGFVWGAGLMKWGVPVSRHRSLATAGGAHV